VANAIADDKAAKRLLEIIEASNMSSFNHWKFRRCERGGVTSPFRKQRDHNAHDVGKQH
jgi:hypothetical protein